MRGRRIRFGVLAYLILAVFLIPSRAGAAEPFVIVSDVDDTVKITNVQDHIHAIQNARRQAPRLNSDDVDEPTYEFTVRGSDSAMVVTLNGQPVSNDFQINLFGHLFIWNQRAITPGQAEHLAHGQHEQRQQQRPHEG